MYIERKDEVATRHIVECLKPATLQKKVKEDLEFAYSTLQTDWKAFRKNVTERTILWDQFENISRLQAPIRVPSAQGDVFLSKQQQRAPYLGIKAIDLPQKDIWEDQYERNTGKDISRMSEPSL
jgi:hypothetical protein